LNTRAGECPIVRWSADDFRDYLGSAALLTSGTEPTMPISFLLFPLLFWGAVLGGGFYLAVRLIRALENRSTGGPEIDDLRKRMSLMEDSFEAMNKRVERIGESQDFTTRLLTERSDSEQGDRGP
jgi:hypothetical protein